MLDGHRLKRHQGCCRSKLPTPARRNASSHPCRSFSLRHFLNRLLQRPWTFLLTKASLLRTAADQLLPEPSLDGKRCHRQLPPGERPTMARFPNSKARRPTRREDAMAA